MICMDSLAAWKPARSFASAVDAHALALFMWAQLHLRAQVQRIGAKEVHWTDSEGQAHSSAADSVILATGAQADDSLALALQAAGKPVHRVGDCADIGFIEGAMHQGHAIGRTV